MNERSDELRACLRTEGFRLLLQTHAPVAQAALARAAAVTPAETAAAPPPAWTPAATWSRSLG